MSEPGLSEIVRRVLIAFGNDEQGIEALRAHEPKAMANMHKLVREAREAWHREHPKLGFPYTRVDGEGVLWAVFHAVEHRLGDVVALAPEGHFVAHMVAEDIGGGWRRARVLPTHFDIVDGKIVFHEVEDGPEP